MYIQGAVVYATEKESAECANTSRSSASRSSVSLSKTEEGLKVEVASKRAISLVCASLLATAPTRLVCSSRDLIGLSRMGSTFAYFPVTALLLNSCVLPTICILVSVEAPFFSLEESLACLAFVYLGRVMSMVFK